MMQIFVVLKFSKVQQKCTHPDVADDCVGTVGGSTDALSVLSLSRRNHFADLRRAGPNNRHLLTPCLCNLCQADTF